MTEQQKDYAQVVQRVLRQRHWTQAALAERLRVWPGTISRWKSGVQAPDGPACVLLDALETGEAPEWLTPEKAAGGGSLVEELERLATFQQQGILTEEEFQQAKARVLD